MESMPLTPPPAAGRYQVLPFTIWGRGCSDVNGLFLDCEKGLGVPLLEIHHASAPED